MSYLKALLLAALSALVTFAIAGPIQLWLVDQSVERELQRQMREQMTTGVGSGGFAIARSVSVLTPLLCAAVVFAIVLVLTVRWRRQTVASTE
jgi:hypothetical protein